MDDTAGADPKNAVDFGFTNWKWTTSQQNLDRTGKFKGEFEYTAYQNNPRYRHVQVKFILQRNTNPNKYSWVKERSYKAYITAPRKKGEVRQVPYSFNIDNSLYDGYYRVKAVIQRISDYHLDKNKKNNVKFSHTRIVDGYTNRIGSGSKSSVRLQTDSNTPVEVIMTITPNPASDIVTINLENIRDAAGELKINDITGALIRTEQINGNQQEIDISMLSNGIYFMSYQTDTGFRALGKISIQH